MNLILFDDPVTWLNLHPFTLTRPTAKIRVGIRTIDEKWEYHLKLKPSYITAPYLSKKYPLTATDDNLMINGSLCPDDHLLKAIEALETGEYLVQGDCVVASRQTSANTEHLRDGKAISYSQPITTIDKTWKIFRHNAEQIRSDYGHITRGRTSNGIQDKYTRVYGEENIFVEEGVDIRAAIINAE